MHFRAEVACYRLERTMMGCAEFTKNEVDGGRSRVHNIHRVVRQGLEQVFLLVVDDDGGPQRSHKGNP